VAEYQTISAALVRDLGPVAATRMKIVVVTRFDLSLPKLFHIEGNRRTGATIGAGVGAKQEIPVPNGDSG